MGYMRFGEETSAPHQIGSTPLTHQIPGKLSCRLVTRLKLRSIEVHCEADNQHVFVETQVRGCNHAFVNLMLQLASPFPGRPGTL